MILIVIGLLMLAGGAYTLSQGLPKSGSWLMTAGIAVIIGGFRFRAVAGSMSSMGSSQEEKQTMSKFYFGCILLFALLVFGAIGSVTLSDYRAAKNKEANAQKSADQMESLDDSIATFRKERSAKLEAMLSDDADASENLEKLLKFENEFYDAGGVADGETIYITIEAIWDVDNEPQEDAIRKMLTRETSLVADLIAPAKRFGVKRIKTNTQLLIASNRVPAGPGSKLDLNIEKIDTDDVGKWGPVPTERFKPAE